MFCGYTDTECLQSTVKKEPTTIYKRRPIRSQALFHELRSKMVKMADQLEQKIDIATSTDDAGALKYKKLCDIIPPSIALPPVPSNLVNNDENTNNMNCKNQTQDTDDPTLVYGIIDEIMALQLAEKIPLQRSKELIELILSAYHDAHKQKRVYKLLAFVKERGPLFKYLDLIEMDLNLG